MTGGIHDIVWDDIFGSSLFGVGKYPDSVV